MTWFAPANNDVSKWVLQGDRFGFGKPDSSMAQTNVMIAPEVPYIYLSDSSFSLAMDKLSNDL